MKFLKRYEGVFGIFSQYWRAYGGWKELVRSFYLHLAILGSIACYPIWANKIDACWYDIPLSVIPNLLGFTLGGYAILLAFGSEKFLENIAGPEADGSPSPYMEVNAAFIHFLIIQALSLFISLLGKAWELDNSVSGFFGFTVFLYALTTLIAACMAVFRVAGWYDEHMGSGENDACKNDESKNDINY